MVEEHQFPQRENFVKGEVSHEVQLYLYSVVGFLLKVKGTWDSILLCKHFNATTDINELRQKSVQVGTEIDNIPKEHLRFQKINNNDKSTRHVIQHINEITL